MPRGSPRRPLLPFALLALLVSGSYAAGWLEAIEHRLMDARFRILRRDASTGVVIVAIDPKSLRALDVWPWVRGYHATVLENLMEAGARLVAFDVDFSSRSIPEEDQAFQAAIHSTSGRVVLPVFQQWERDRDGRTRLTETSPLPAFSRPALLGSINVHPDADGLVRTYALQEAPPSPRSMAAVLARVENLSHEAFHIDFGIRPDSIPQVSFVDVLTRQYDPKIVADRVVIIGATAVELGDRAAVPLTASMPGPLIQALAYESLAEGRALLRVSPALVIAVTVLLALLLGPLLAAAPSWQPGLVLVVAISLGAFGLSVAVQRLSPFLLDVAPWILAALGAYAFSLVRRIDHQTVLLLLQRLRIRRTEVLMRHVVDRSFDAIVTITEEGSIETFNTAAETMFGAPASESIGRSFAERILPVDFQADHGTREAVGRRRDGSTFPVETAWSDIFGEGRRLRVVVLRDITERKAHHQTLEHQARHDALTGLPNRILLRERIVHSLRTAQEGGGALAFLILDLDRFKEVNDTLGHHVGDLLLQQIARRLERAVGLSGTIARLGGDEFAVLLPDADLETARSVSRWLLDSLLEPFELQGFSLQIDASIGIAMFPEHGREASELIQRADVAMYAAKRAHAGTAVYATEQDFNSVRHLKLNGELRKAIEEDRLVLHYQPKVESRTGRIVGAEALVRWNHTEYGWLRPEEFIGLAEHSGLIRPLTQWVLTTALGQCVAWEKAGHGIGVAVNLSARNLMEEGIQHDIERLLRRHGCPPERLTIEITESVIMEDPRRALSVVTDLVGLGVQIAIDDFGTGYSSLGYLKKLPAGEIKVDKSFVQRMDRDRDDAVIVGSTIQMAHNLGLKVVAEGVETDEIWRELKKLGCDFGQGYLFSRPVPAAALAALLENPSTVIA